MKKVAVLMSTYNGEKYLRQLIDSVLAQNTNNGEIEIKFFVRDDGSQDGTLEILKEYQDKGLLTLGQNCQHLGFAQSFSWLLKNVEQCDYYAFCDQDDVWLPNKIFNAVEALSKQDNHVPLLYSTSLIVVDENLKEITRQTHLHLSQNSATQFEENVLQNNTYGCTVVFNEKLRQEYMTVPTEQIVAHDYILAILSAAFGKFIFEEKPEILYRQHTNNTIGFYKGSFRNISRTLKFVLDSDMKNKKFRNVEILKKYFYEKLSPQQQTFVDNLYYYKTNAYKKKEVVRFIKKNIKNKFIKNYNLVLLRLNKF